MTVEENIEAALYERVATLDLDGEPPLAMPNVAFDPPFGPYIRVAHLRNNNARLFMKGSDPHLRQGILQLTVVVPLLQGNVTDAMALAGAIAAHFPADLALYSEGVKVRIQQAPDVLGPELEAATWELPVSIRYEAFA